MDIVQMDIICECDAVANIAKELYSYFPFSAGIYYDEFYYTVSIFFIVDNDNESVTYAENAKKYILNCLSENYIGLSEDNVEINYIGKINYQNMITPDIINFTDKTSKYAYISRYTDVMGQTADKPIEDEQEIVEIPKKPCIVNASKEENIVEIASGNRKIFVL